MAEFKSIKELGEGCGCGCSHNYLCLECKSKIRYAKETVEMIKEYIKITEDGIRKWEDDRDETIRLNSQLATSKHFLAEIKGEEK